MKKFRLVFLALIALLSLCAILVGCGSFQKGSKGLTFVSNGDGTCSLWGIGECTDVEVVVPSKSPDGDKVTAVAKGAFKKNDTIASIHLPASVEVIEEEAFSGCSRLLRVTFAEDSKLVEMKDGAFSSCKELTAITLPDGLTKIGGGAFSVCQALTSITIPAGVTEIPSSTFCYCYDLSEVTFAEGSRLQSIGANAFTECALTKINIPSTVTELGSAALYGCNFTSFSLPSKVTVITQHQFCATHELTDLYLHKDVTKIEDYAFLKSENMTIHYEGSKADWTAIEMTPSALSMQNGKLTIICTDGTIEG